MKPPKVKLDRFERSLERSFRRDKWVTVSDPKEREKVMEAARRSKSERTNIRLSESDLMGIKEKADQKGLGYQTLIASLVHQYVTGRLIETDSNELVDLIAEAIEKRARPSQEPRRSKSAVKRRAAG